jgi:SAM-dependent methyltransferase
MERDPIPFWERPEIVEKFAGREPDRRLAEWLSGRPDLEGLRVLDIGCAGGRNSEFLARSGCELYAIDASLPMVRRTRFRVANVLGEREAARRVRVGRMELLGGFRDRSFDLIVALGVFHSAPDRATYELALAESARVLDDNGLLLIANFAPGTQLEGTVLEPAADEADVYIGHESGRHVLLDAEALDEALGRHGLTPVVPTEVVEAEGEATRRITVNGLYRKRAS